MSETVGRPHDSPFMNEPLGPLLIHPTAQHPSFDMFAEVQQSRQQLVFSYRPPD